MTADLFPAATSVSPHLRWLAAHNLITRHDKLPHTFVGADNTKPWVCANKAMTRLGFGDDEREAEMAFADRYGVKHWLVEDWERAMGPALEDLDA